MEPTSNVWREIYGLCLDGGYEQAQELAFNRARVLLEKPHASGEIAEALGLLGMVLTLTDRVDRLAETYYWMSVCLQKLKAYDNALSAKLEAKHLWKGALRQDPSNPVFKKKLDGNQEGIDSLLKLLGKPVHPPRT